MLIQDQSNYTNNKLNKLLANNSPLLSAFFSTLPDTFAIYAFGSQVQSVADSNSDLDLAVLVAGYANPFFCGIYPAIWQIWQDARWIYWICALHLL
jgi:predicted nucleotidyltransferase